MTQPLILFRVHFTFEMTAGAHLPFLALPHKRFERRVSFNEIIQSTETKRTQNDPQYYHRDYTDESPSKVELLETPVL